MKRVLLKKSILFVTAAVFVFFVFIAPISGFTARGGDTVNISEVQNDDTYISAGTLNISGAVNFN